MLNEAVRTAIKKRGSYTILSNAAFTGPKRDKLVKVARAAIKNGGANPGRLKSVDVLDANKIAEWANLHPSVALWLAKLSRKRSLAGFQTHEGWGKSAEIRVSPWVESSTPRFTAVNVPVLERDLTEPQNKAWTFDRACDAVLDQLAQEQRSVRIAGPSGFGKSRFLYEVFNKQNTVGERTDNASVIYADYSIVGDEVAKLALEIAEAGAASILVVDECPDQLHHRLALIAQRDGSHLRIATIDVETRIEQTDTTLTLRLEPANKELISAIAKGVDPGIPENAIGFIQELSHGFPQMAVLAAKQKGSKKQTIRSAEQYVTRVLWGQSAPKEDAQKALSVLSMFDWVGIAGQGATQGEYIATHLARMPFDQFVEHVKSFKARGIVIQRGDFVQVQPIPLAARLAGTRLPLLPDNKLLEFFSAAPSELKASLLKRIRWLDTVPEARMFAEALLAKEALGNFETLNTETGSEILDRLVHVSPDVAMRTIEREFGELSVEQLKEVTAGRRHLVWALEKLVFRNSTFLPAASLLRKLAAAETEDHIANNATGQFKGLYRLYLSGTEADPASRLIVLDDGLDSNVAREREVCIEALDEMLEAGHYSRGGGAEEIGSADALKDWQPKTYGDIRNFFRAARDRLTRIALSNDSFALKAKAIIGRRIRAMLNQFEPSEIKKQIRQIINKYGFWPEAAQEVNEWLYFDSKTAPPEIRTEIRAYFDELLPKDPVALAELYCSGWQTDFHDPDVAYDKGNASDFEYASRKAIELVPVIAADDALLDRALDRFATNDLKTAFPFARRLAELVDDPTSFFTRALKKADVAGNPPNLQFFGGIISAADKRDPKLARACIAAALQSPKLRPHAIPMIASGQIQPDGLALVISLLRSGDVEPFQCASLSYGRGLDHLQPKQFMPFLNEMTRHGAPGLWAALDIVSMYLHPAKEPDDVLTQKIKQILLAPKLFDRINRRTMDGYHLEQMLALLEKHKKIDETFVKSLVRRLMSLSKTDNSDMFFELDGPVRKILARLVTSYPKEVWSEVAPFLLIEDVMVRHRVQQLLGSGHREELETGPLGNLPDTVYLDWVRLDPSARAHHVAQWIPLVGKEANGALTWHPVAEAFVTEFGSIPSALDEISRRMHPRSWSDSLVPHLEAWLPLVRAWLNHSSADIRKWAQARLDGLRKYIESERKRDEEDVVRWG